MNDVVVRFMITPAARNGVAAFRWTYWLRFHVWISLAAFGAVVLVLVVRHLIRFHASHVNNNFDALLVAWCLYAPISFMICGIGNARQFSGFRQPVS